MPRYLSFHFCIVFFMLFCFVLTSPPLMLCVYLQTFEAALFLEEEEYKLSVICHSFFLGLSPIYLSELLSVYTPKRNLRSSSDNRILCIPKPRTKTFGHRSFSFAAPTIWNSLHSELRHTDSIQKFKSARKTHLLGKFFT